MNIAYIAIGSNLDDPHQQVIRAVSAIKSFACINAQSSWYLSRAVNPPELPDYSQPDYVNGVVAIETAMDAASLLSALQQIENQQGRKRIVRWGARTLDLDILLFNNDIISSPDLTIPHPRLTSRNFVAYPLHEIAPELMLPDGSYIADILSKLSTEGLEKLSQNG